MGKVDRLRNRVKLWLPCFGLSALYLPSSNTWPCPPARHHSTTVHNACPHMVIVGSILNKDALASPPPLFLSRCVIYLWKIHERKISLRCVQCPFSLGLRGCVATYFKIVISYLILRRLSYLTPTFNTYILYTNELKDLPAEGQSREDIVRFVLSELGWRQILNIATTWQRITAFRDTFKYEKYSTLGVKIKSFDAILGGYVTGDKVFVTSYTMFWS